MPKTTFLVHKHQSAYWLDLSKLAIAGLVLKFFEPSRATIDKNDIWSVALGLSMNDTNLLLFYLALAILILAIIISEKPQIFPWYRQNHKTKTQ